MCRSSSTAGPRWSRLASMRGTNSAIGLTPSELVVRRVRRRRLMQCGDEVPQPLRLPGRRGQGDVGRDITVEERAHAPAPGKSMAGHALANRSRDRDREDPGELGEPAVLVLDEVGTELTARQADDEIVTEAEDRVVPSERQRRQRKVGEIGMLLGEQGPDEVVGDVDLGGGHVLRRHGISPSKRARRSGSRRGTTSRFSSSGRSRRPRSAGRSAAAAHAAGSASACAGCTRRA